MSTQRDLNEVLDEFRTFHHDFQTLLMATCNAQGEPDASYAPYVEHLGDFYVYVSELAVHTGNLQANPRCSVLFIEDEKQAKHLFGRRRVTLDCVAEAIPRDSTLFETVMGQFIARFGKFMEMLRQLQDFHLIRLKPQRGNYVAGFAQAYEITGQDLDTIRHRTEKGHRAANQQTADAMAAVQEDSTV